MTLFELSTSATCRRMAYVIPTRVKADSFQGFQNGASSESCPSASATGPMHDAQCGLVLAPSKKAYHLQQGVGHYGVFNGTRFRAEIAPRIAQFIQTHDPVVARSGRAKATDLASVA